MPVDVPAFCDSCAAVFRSGVVVEDFESDSFAEDGLGPCPVCNGKGHIPKGFFKFTQRSIGILSAPQYTLDELTRLAQMLYDAKKDAHSSEQLADTIRRDVPELASLADILNDNGVESLVAPDIAQMRFRHQQPCRIPLLQRSGQ